MSAGLDGHSAEVYGGRAAAPGHAGRIGLAAVLRPLRHRGLEVRVRRDRSGMARVARALGPAAAPLVLALHGGPTGSGPESERWTPRCSATPAIAS